MKPFTTAAPSPLATDDPDAQFKRVRLAVIAGGMAAILDSTMITIALHKLVGSLHTTVGNIQWVTTGYLLALSIAISLTGWLEARLGGRRAWMTALGLFIVGSVLCAFAWNVGSLIAFRAVQGFGGGLIITLMTTLAVRAAGGKATPRLMASITMPLAIGPVLGPVLGGIILSALSWRWLFLVNVPIIAVAFYLAARALPKGGVKPKDERAPLDVIGLILLAPGLTGVLLGLTELAQHGGLAYGAVLIPLVAGVVLLAAFVGWALRPTGKPIVDLRLLRARSLGTACATLFTTHASLYAGLFLLPLYYQNARHDSVLAAGLLLIPQGAGIFASRFVVGRMVDQFGARAVTIGCFLLAAVTTLPFAFADAKTNLWWLGAVLVIRGFAVGALIIPASSVAYNDVNPATIPHATMNTRIAQQVGASFGTAIVAVVLEAALTHGTVHAFHQAFWWATGIAIVGIIPALRLPVRRVTSGAKP